jgi:uncharacterized protein (DUF1330 family)
LNLDLARIPGAVGNRGLIALGIWMRELIFTNNPKENAMNRSIALGIAMLGGAAVGATAIQTLHAQAKPPTYVVIDIAKMIDPEGFKAVTSSLAAGEARVQELGGRYIIRSTTMSAVDGSPPARFVVLAFDSKEKAQGWVDASDIKAINAIRAKTTDSSAFIVDGLAE